MAGTEETQETEEKEPIKLSFSVPQIVGGALAASTAAAIGSQLGVAGTILGAAVASMIGGIAGTLYSAGIDRTHRKVSEAIQRGYEKVHTGDGDAAGPLVADGGDPAQPAGSAPTQVLDDLEDSIFRTDTDRTRVDQAPVRTGAGEPPRQGKPVWKVMLLTAGAMFLIALAVITVVELGLGRTLDGRDGTTVSQVVRPEATTPSTPTPTPTVTVTSTPTASATVTATTTPSASSTPTTSETPTAAATTQEPTPAASSTGSAEPVSGATPAG